MKQIVLIAAALFCFGSHFAQERILSYHSQIQIQESGELLVQENIRVQAEGNQIKRGIYRSFPTHYKDKMGTQFKVGFEVVQVLKEGSPEPFFTENKNNGIVVYIGDKNTFLSPGTYNYTLIYKTTRQIGFFDQYDELYFNAIGGDWTFNIEKSSVVVKLPANASILQVEAFSGKQGNTHCDCTISKNNNQIVIETTRPLLPREQLTFAVAWLKGFVKEPTTLEKWVMFFKSNFHVWLSLLGLGFVFAMYYKAWKKVGVDPPKGTIFPQFDPPEGFSAGDIAILHVLRSTQRAVTATIVGLAVKGHINIKYLKKKYTLERISQNTTDLNQEEKAIANALFSNAEHITLDAKNHTRFAKAKMSTLNAIQKKLKPTYFSFNYSYLVKGILASVILVIVTFLVAPSPVVPLLLLIILLLLVAVFTYLIKAPTTLGRKVMDDIEGFKMYLNVAEQKQLDTIHEPEMTEARFETLLPFAIALGVENQWGKKFETHLAQSLQKEKSYNPSWYTGAAAATAFSPARFSSEMGKSFSSAIAAASTPPGRSSGSGGGGFSGGGGGGGGGGGW